MESMIVEPELEYYYSRGSAKAYSDLAEAYAVTASEMLALHEGTVVAALAEAILAQLPTSPISLLASSDEGLALAAVCAALRSDGTDWRRVQYAGPVETFPHQPVVVEPVDGGRGWRQAILRRYPSTLFVVAERDPVLAR